MNYPIIYDKFETAFSGFGLAVLEKANNIKVREVINGEFLLSFILPRNDPKWEYIQPENFIKVYEASQKRDQLFRIRTMDEIRDNSGKLTSNIQCEHVWYDANDCKHVPSFEMIGALPRAILEQAFVGTRFTIGTVEITTATDIFLDKTNPAAVTAKLIENVGGELVKDNWTVNLVQKRGNDTGVQFRIGKNIKSIKKNTDIKAIVTRLYPYGKDGLQIDDANGGIPYIDSPLINLYDRPHINHIEYKDIEDPAELLTTAQREWSTSERDGIDKPRVTYTGDFLELKKLREYGNYEAFCIGDSVTIIDEGLGVSTKQRILEYENYPYEPSPSAVAFANYDSSIYRDNRIGNIISNSIFTGDYVDKVTTDKGQLNPQWFENIKSKLKTLFNGGIRQAVMHSQGDIWVDNPDAPTKAMAILADGFAIANNKLANGDWDWKTFGTGDGFVADLIVAGVLRAIDIIGVAISGSTIDGGTITGSTIIGSLIYGGVINVQTDINVGNNINVGNQSPELAEQKSVNFFGSNARITCGYTGYEYTISISVNGTMGIGATGDVIIQSRDGNILFNKSPYAYSVSPGNQMATQGQIDALWAAISNLSSPPPAGG